MNKQNNNLVPVGFACQKEIPNDNEIINMIDEVIYETLGHKGLASIIKPGDKVVIKVNLVGANVGQRGEKGRSIITDARIVRYVAEKVREIIGYGETADIKVVDALFYKEKNPSLKRNPGSFYWARVEKTGDNAVDKEDFCYDLNADGVLDGTSHAKLINLDSLLKEDRIEYKVKVASGRVVTLSMPKFLRKKKDAEGSNQYCDVLIGLPIFKNHGIMGMTGALKLHYGFRHYEGIYGDSGRYGHGGTFYDEGGDVYHRALLSDYICAEHIIRKYDFIIMDALTGNFTGPLTILGENGGLTRVDYDMAANYICSNAILASRDSVAIDVVEAELAGYNPTSIEDIAAAATNGLGINNIGRIEVKKLSKFSSHRAMLYDKYHPLMQYPFIDGYGGAKVLPSIKSNYKVVITDTDTTEDGCFRVSYRVKSDTRDMPVLTRAELWINKNRVVYNIDGDLVRGELKVKLEDMGVPSGTRVVYFIAVWDDKFNCQTTFDKFYKVSY